MKFFGKALVATLFRLVIHISNFCKHKLCKGVYKKIISQKKKKEKKTKGVLQLKGLSWPFCKFALWKIIVILCTFLVSGKIEASICAQIEEIYEVQIERKIYISHLK